MANAADRRTLPGPSRLGPYELITLVGAGGMGEVYRARDTRLHRTVAVKLLRQPAAADPERRRRFEFEARAASALEHPNICTVHDVGCQDGTDFIVMEFLEGETLAARLRCGQLPVDQVLQYGAQIADALARAHRRRIVHRDVKPANIMLTQSGVKLLDFGLAKLKPDDGDTTTTVTTRTNADSVEGPIVGTCYYMSPEQAQGLHVDHRSDIFSLGVVLYEMSTGARPFSGATRAAVISSILRDSPALPNEIDPSLPSELSRVVRRCLKKDPEERYQSASDLRGDLQDLGEQVRATHAASKAVTRTRTGSRGPLLVGAVAVASVALLTVVWLASATRDGPQEAGSPGHEAAAAAAGLPPMQVTAEPGWETHPALSADGSLVAYASNQSGNADVWVVGLGGGRAVNVSDHPGADEKPAWFPDGSALAFASDRSGQWSVWRAPALGGGATLLLPNARDPAISPDGRRLAFVRADASGVARVMVASLEEPSDTHIAGAVTADRLPYPEQDPAWSPDGTQVCFSSYRSLWIAAATGATSRRLTSDRQDDEEPAWPTDGQSIYFSSYRGGSYTLWRVPAGGGTPQRVTRGVGPERHPSLSRNGARLVFSTFATNTDIVLADLATGKERQFGTTRDEGFPVLAPDGSQLVYTVLPTARGRGQLWRQRLSDGWPAGEPQLLADQEGGLSLPDVSPDGKWVTYQRVFNGQNDIWLIPMEGGEPVRVTDDKGHDVHPTFSPEGRRIAFASSRAGSLHIFVAAVRNGRPDGVPRQLTHEAGAQDWPAWLAGGTRIAYIADEPSTAGIWETDEGRESAPRCILRTAVAQYLRWDTRNRGLVISGYWEGTPALTLRLVDVRSGQLRSFHPAFRIGEGPLPMFSFRADGRFVVFARGALSGDVWVTELE